MADTMMVWVEIQLPLNG